MYFQIKKGPFLKIPFKTILRTYAENIQMVLSDIAIRQGE